MEWHGGNYRIVMTIAVLIAGLLTSISTYAGPWRGCCCEDSNLQVTMGTETMKFDFFFIQLLKSMVSSI
jgi:hypothetical protein